MLTSYIRAAMRQARYEIVEDDRSFYGNIPATPGVWANAKTLEACREELESVLEGWADENKNAYLCSSALIGGQMCFLVPPHARPFRHEHGSKPSLHW